MTTNPFDDIFVPDIDLTDPACFEGTQEEAVAHGEYGVEISSAPKLKINEEKGTARWLIALKILDSQELKRVAGAKTCFEGINMPTAGEIEAFKEKKTGNDDHDAELADRYSMKMRMAQEFLDNFQIPLGYRSLANGDLWKGHRCLVVLKQHQWGDNPTENRIQKYISKLDPAGA